MGTQPSNERDDLRQAKETNNPLVQTLVRKFVREVSKETGSEIGDREGAQAHVILDVEVDDVRCMIVQVAQGEQRDVRDLLSPREREIARMVAKGFTNRTIASVLEISSWTVSTHLRRMFLKLNVCSRAALVARLLQKNEPA